MKKIIHLLIWWTLLSMGGYFYVAYFLPLEFPHIPSSTVFLDNDGQEIGEIIYSGSIRHREIATERIPDFYKTSLIAMEDRTFWTNDGISLRWIIRSMVHNVVAGKVVEWGTTISSGLIRNIFWIREDRTFGKKILEFLYAIRLNHLYPKDRILTEYVNRVDFGYLNRGLGSAAEYYFGRKPENLTKAEQIALLILPKDPKAYDPYKKPKNFRSRFEKTIYALAKGNTITPAESKDMLWEKLDWSTEHGDPLPYVTDFLKTTLKDRTAKDIVRTTFDRTLTERIDTIAKNTLSELAWRNVSDYGILIAERTGKDTSPELRVMIGGIDYSESTAWQVNTTLSLRQPGSTIKPFTYALAFERLGLLPESTILDLPIAYRTSDNYAYEPKNYSQDYKGEITLRQALSESVNIPAVQLIEKIGVSVLLDFLRWLGITSLRENPDHYGLGLTLGNGEISLFELLQSYTIFSNGGKYCPFRTMTDIPNIQCIERMHPEYTDMVISILSDRYAKLGGFPLHSALDFPDRNVFVKTGTSRNFRDNWTVGFTDRYMIGVWTGNKNGENMKGVSGATGAGEIFRRIVYVLEKEEKKQIPMKLQGNGQPYLLITNPLKDSLYKQEQWKNTGKQEIRLRFETNIPYDTMQWMLDGTETKDDFIGIIPWEHTIKAILRKNGEIVGEEKNTFRMEGVR